LHMHMCVQVVVLPSCLGLCVVCHICVRAGGVAFMSKSKSGVPHVFDGDLVTQAPPNCSLSLF